MKLYINSVTADNLLKITNNKFSNEKVFSELLDAIDSLQDVSITDEPTVILHPVKQN